MWFFIMFLSPRGEDPILGFLSSAFYGVLVWSLHCRSRSSSFSLYFIFSTCGCWKKTNKYYRFLLYYIFGVLFWCLLWFLDFIAISYFGSLHEHPTIKLKGWMVKLLLLLILFIVQHMVLHNIEDHILWVEDITIILHAWIVMHSSYSNKSFSC